MHLLSLVGRIRPIQPHAAMLHVPSHASREPNGWSVREYTARLVPASVEHVAAQYTAAIYDQHHRRLARVGSESKDGSGAGLDPKPTGFRLGGGGGEGGSRFCPVGLRIRGPDSGRVGVGFDPKFK